MEDLSLLIPFFFVTALLYSMAGFGGGSTYIALLILFSVPYEIAPKIALLCNLTVVSTSCFFFARAGYVSLKRTLPFLMASIPMAYWGGSIPISQTLFHWLLALSLAAVGCRLFVTGKVFHGRTVLSWRRAWLVGTPVGALLGFLAGLVGIGGGIFLAPVLLLLGWANAKQAAAAASIFIFVNSIAGLMGQFAKESLGTQMSTLVPFLLAVFAGGQIGSRLGSETFPIRALQKVTACLVLIVSARLVWGLL